MDAECSGSEDGKHHYWECGYCSDEGTTIEILNQIETLQKEILKKDSYIIRLEDEKDIKLKYLDWCKNNNEGYDLQGNKI